jgi:hypothetical protein
MQSHTGEFPDQDILRIGRKHFVEIHTEPSAVKILRDAVIRPGRKGGEFGYWAQYQRLTADGEWIEEEHYDE